MSDVPENLGQRILDLANIAAVMHQEARSPAAGGTGAKTSKDGAATQSPGAKKQYSSNRLGPDRIR